MNIVQQKWEFYQHIVPFAPAQLHKLFRFGWETLTAQRIQSLRANARLSNLKWHTAKTKVYRLCKNAKMPQIFPRLLVHVGIVGEHDVITVDFSDFCNGFQVLMFAKQTRKGRAIPLYFEILRFLRRNQYKLIVRVKKCKAVYDTEIQERILVKNAHQSDLRVRAYRYKLRVVISEHTGKDEEPWYLVTNDFWSSREKIIDAYYHRFEIEEFFRDAKRLLG